MGHYCSYLQGTSKRLLPGCVKSGEKVAFCLPTAGRQENAIFSPHILTTWEEPYSQSLEFGEPCETGVAVALLHRGPCHDMGESTMQGERES